MIGGLVLWLSWSAKSPLNTSATDAAKAQGAADASTIIPAKTKPGSWSPPTGGNPPGTYTPPASLKTLLLCTSRGGTWDYANNVCVEKH